ncbi:carboxypeptidase C (cathepsin A) [Idiomarina xiamenensis 10-D-4]|uniref:Carboxypeptidase C (Cathepsin A) n=2 Tax=Idiomarina xiamenensis TaxID=1207041 RepID=K2JHP0_9GAMM|nr:carboxypeptidase C (cathepsin A) [Idiomarina xiamenensis 10-D-4]
MTASAIFCACALTMTPVLSQPVFAASEATEAATSQSAVPAEEASTTEHSVRINGDSFDYKATAGNLVIKDDKGDPSASVFYVAYTVPSDDDEPRPVTFLFNGGPGSASLWLHMGSFGPVRVATENAAPTPPPPYELKQNPYSLLNKTDLVFIDAFGTGFSRGLAQEGDDKGKNPSSKFWGVDQDVDGFARFITRYVTVNQRWNSPKFLLGESYGTVRAPALVNHLQDQGMGFNGVILVSSILNYGADAPGLDREYVGLLPTFAATAWYHNQLPQKPEQLAGFLDEVRQFAEGDYAQALAQGHNLPAEQQRQIAERVHQYTGLSVDYLVNANLRVDQSHFRKELMRDSDTTLGRFDTRYMGLDKDAIGARPDSDPSDTAASSAFISTFNNYLTGQLDYHADRPYQVFSRDAIMTWDWSHQVPGSGWPVQMPYVVDDLGNAMRTNPGLKVFSANGYYDLATPFHATEYDLAHMQLQPQLQKNVQIEYYPSGHMIYLNEKALVDLHKDLEQFYDNAVSY